MNRKKVQKTLTYISRALFVLLGLIMAYGCVAIETTKKSPEEIAKIIKMRQKVWHMIATGERPVDKNIPTPWPPEMNRPYPKIALIDQEGKDFNLIDLKGKVIVVEYVDMTSPISQAQSGAHLSGAYTETGSDVDKYALSFSDALRQATSGQLTLPHPDIVLVKILMYAKAGDAASKDDAKYWAQHFHLLKSEGNIVAVPRKDIRGDVGASLISGYQLIDRNYMLRVDSAGLMPKHNLKMTLIPLVPRLLR